MILAAAGELERIEGTFSKNGTTVYQGITSYFIEDSLLQNVIMGLEFNKLKYINIIKTLGLEQFMSGINQSENALLLHSAAYLPEDVKRLIVLARLMYIDAEIYLIDKFFDYFPNKFIDTALSYIVKTYFKDKTMLVATDNIHVASLFPRSILLSKRTIQTTLQYNQLANEYKHFFNQTTFFNLVDLQAEKKDKIVIDQEQDYIELLANYERNWYTQQKEIIGGYQIENKMKELGEYYEEKAFYFLSNLKQARPLKRTYVLGRFFLFNSGWILPTITVTLIIVNFLATYSFTCFVISWKQKFFNWETKEYIQAFVVINAVLVFSVIAMNHIMITYVRQIAVKLFVYTIKGLLVHSLEWFHASAFERIISSVITEFNYFEENISDALRNNISIFIKLHVAVLICLYNSHFTGVLILLVYFLIMASVLKIISGIRYVRDIICCNQSYLIHTGEEWFRGLPQFRNYGNVNYHQRAYTMICEIYHNSKSHQGNIAERWLYTRIHGLVLFIPLLLIINGVVRYWIGWPPDFFEIIKITIAFDLVFTIGPMVNSTILQAALLTVLERLRDIIIEDEIAKKRKILAIGMMSYCSVQKVILKINDMVIANPLTKTILLCSVQMEVNTGAKLAITGSRGAGKRTLLEAIYRMIDYKRIVSGSIYFKGQNIMDMSDDAIYSSMIMLSGSYKLMPGTIRDNLDPKRKFSDDQITSALTYVGYWKLLEYETDMSVKREMGKSIVDIKSTVVNFHSKAFTSSLKDDLDDIRNKFKIKVKTENRVPKFERTHEVFLDRRNNDYDEKVKNYKRKEIPKKQLGEFKFTGINDYKDLVKEGFVAKEELNLDSIEEIDSHLLDDAVIDQTLPSLPTMERFLPSNITSKRSTSNMILLVYIPKSRHYSIMKKQLLPEENLDLCIEGCSVDNEEDPDSSEDEEREGFFNTILQDGRLTDERDLLPQRMT